MNEIQAFMLIDLVELVVQGLRVLVFTTALCAFALFGLLIHRWARGH